MFNSEKKKKTIKFKNNRTYRLLSESTQAQSRKFWFLECLMQKNSNKRTPLMVEVLDPGRDVR